MGLMGLMHLKLGQAQPIQLQTTHTVSLQRVVEQEVIHTRLLLRITEVTRTPRTTQVEALR